MSGILPSQRIAAQAAPSTIHNAPRPAARPRAQERIPTRYGACPSDMPAKRALHLAAMRARLERLDHRIDHMTEALEAVRLKAPQAASEADAFLLRQRAGAPDSENNPIWELMTELPGYSELGEAARHLVGELARVKTQVATFWNLESQILTLETRQAAACGNMPLYAKGLGRMLRRHEDALDLLKAQYEAIRASAPAQGVELRRFADRHGLTDLGGDAPLAASLPGFGSLDIQARMLGVLLDGLRRQGCKVKALVKEYADLLGTGAPCTPPAASEIMLAGCVVDHPHPPRAGEEGQG